MEYTTGEWRYEDDRIVTGYRPDEGLIATMNGDQYEKENEANAYLITAAPNMYEALKSISKEKVLSPIRQAAVERILAKAEGWVVNKGR